MEEELDKPLIQFVSTVPGLSEVDESRPKPTQKFIPEWWKKTPLLSHPMESYFDKEIVNTVRGCPSFPDYFSQGYVVPMWTDSVLRYDKKTNEWNWLTKNKNFDWELHPNQQLGPHMVPTSLGKLGYAVFKAICPWRLITPPGYSVWQLPMFYELNQDFTVLPGVIRSDGWSHINQQVLLHTDKEELFIKRGTPLAQYIPFKRSSFDLEVRDATEEDKKLFLKHDMHVTTKFIGSKEYIHLTKEIEEQLK